MSSNARLPAFLGLLAGIVLFAACVLNGRQKARMSEERELCPARVAELRSWLRVLAREGDVWPEVVGPHDDRYVDRPLPPVPLVQRDEPPAPFPRVALVWLDRSTARFGDFSAGAADAHAVDDLMQKVSASDLSPAFGSGHLGVFYMFQPVVMLIGANERWSDVTKLVDGAARRGFSHAHFVFGVKSDLPAPRKTASASRIVALATDPNEMPYKREIAAARELGRLHATCPAIVAPFRKESTSNIDADEQRTAFIDHVADDVAACSCRADLDAIKTFAWVRYGRHWGATTVSYELQITTPEREKDAASAGAEELSAPADAPWSETHARVIDASKRKARAFFSSER